VVVPPLGSVPDCEVTGLEVPVAGGAAGLLSDPAGGDVAWWAGLVGHGVPVVAGARIPVFAVVAVLVAPGSGATDPLVLGDGSVLGEGSVLGPALPLAVPDELPAGAEDVGALAGPVRDVPSWAQVEAAGLACRVPPVDALLAPETRPAPAEPPALPPFGLVPWCPAPDVLSAPEGETT
jgi:hypothetical protein